MEVPMCFEMIGTLTFTIDHAASPTKRQANVFEVEVVLEHGVVNRDSTSLLLRLIPMRVYMRGYIPRLRMPPSNQLARDRHGNFIRQSRADRNA
jgi:hypothetical protein